MGTKINENVWGEVPAIGGTLRINRSLRDLIAAGLYDPDTGNFDMSVSPWGIGYSNAGNYSIPWYTRTGEAASTSSNRISKMGCENSKSYNTPFLMGYGIYGLRENYTDEYTRPMQRIYGGTTKDNENYIISTVKYDLGDKPPSYNVSASDSVANLKPVLYLDYQSIKIVSTALQWINLIDGTITRTVLTNPTQYNSYTTAVNSMSLENIGIIAIEYQIYVKTNGRWAVITSDNSYMIHNFKKFKVTDRLKQFYFSGDETEYVQIMPRNYIGAPYKDAAWNSTGGRSIPMESYSYGELATRHSFDNLFSWDSFAGKSSGRFTVGSWSFDDNDYTTDILSFWGGTNPIRELQENDILPYSGYIRTCSVTRITRTTAPRNSTAINTVICHELAFFGLPFVNGWSTNYNTQNIGDDDVYLPIFDEHMLTTGLSARGSAALELPNALWGDVFSDTMPSYDPSYDPTPTPEGDEKDRGDLTNTTPRRYGTSGTKKYVMSAATVNSLQSYLNVSYVPSSADFTKDFKGTNPADYIVSVQRYPFPISHISTAANVVIGGLDTEISAYPLETDLIPAQKFYNFGEISIDPFYDDFRDYQSKITLIMPFIGSVDLDPRLYIGHTVGLKYNVDYDTGAVAAEIKRDGLTLETKTATISITIPFFAANMGSYQNALASTEFAIEQSKLKQIAGITSTALSTGGAIASGGMVSDTTQLGMAGGLLGGVTSMVGGLMQQQQLEYQLEHTAPAVGSVSVAAPANAFYLDDRARIIISRPQMLRGYNAAVYAHTVGNACAVAGTLGSFSGYTVAGACDLSGIAATAQEKKMIKQLLQAGVYV